MRAFFSLYQLTHTYCFVFSLAFSYSTHYLWIAKAFSARFLAFCPTTPFTEIDWWRAICIAFFLTFFSSFFNLFFACALLRLAPTLSAPNVLGWLEDFFTWYATRGFTMAWVHFDFIWNFEHFYGFTRNPRRTATCEACRRLARFARHYSWPPLQPTHLEFNHQN